jgi:hypothetical protein
MWWPNNSNLQPQNQCFYWVQLEIPPVEPLINFNFSIFTSFSKYCILDKVRIQEVGAFIFYWRGPQVSWMQQHVLTVLIREKPLNEARAQAWEGELEVTHLSSQRPGVDHDIFLVGCSERKRCVNGVKASRKGVNGESTGSASKKKRCKFLLLIAIKKYNSREERR